MHLGVMLQAVGQQFLAWGDGGQEVLCMCS